MMSNGMTSQTSFEDPCYQAITLLSILNLFDFER